jgi:hypothetical protein
MKEYYIVVIDEDNLSKENCPDLLTLETYLSDATLEKAKIRCGRMNKKSNPRIAKVQLEFLTK